jgi:hypothetical protein
MAFVLCQESSHLKVGDGCSGSYIGRYIHTIFYTTARTCSYVGYLFLLKSLYCNSDYHCEMYPFHCFKSVALRLEKDIKLRSIPGPHFTFFCEPIFAENRILIGPTEAHYLILILIQLWNNFFMDRTVPYYPCELAATCGYLFE